MDKENLDYLKGITERVVAYDEIRSHVVDFLLDKQIKDIDLATDLFVIGFIWLASQRDETLTDDDLIMFLDGGDDIEPIEFHEQKEYILEENQADMNLFELLELTYNNYND